MSVHAINAGMESARQWLVGLSKFLETEDEAFAYQALGATLHELRDHLSVEEAVHFSAQMPYFIRGLYFDGWRPAGKPVRRRSKEEFLGRISERLRKVPSDDVEEVVGRVLQFLTNKISEGEIEDVLSELPRALKDLFPIK